jgi:hypothetical protein
MRSLVGDGEAFVILCHPTFTAAVQICSNGLELEFFLY